MIRNILIVGVSAVILLIFAVPMVTAKQASKSISTERNSDMAFSVLADKYFDTYYFPTNPTLATQLGVHLYDDQLEDYSATAVKNNIETLKKFETKVEEFDVTGASEQEQANKSLVLNHIRSQLLSLETVKSWEKNPDVYSSGVTYSAFVIISRKFATDEARLQALIAREKLMPAVFAAAKANLNNPPKIYTEIALEQLPGMIHFFQKDVPQAFSEVKDSALQQQFAASNAAVIAALEDYQAWLKNELLPRSHGDFRIGEETFRKQLQFEEMVDTPLDRLVDIDLADMRRNQVEFRRILQELEPNKSEQEAIEKIFSNYPAPDNLLKSFQATFAGLIDFIKIKKIITIPSDVQPILEESPPFLRALSLASMDTPGPFEPKATEAYFNVTLPEAGWDKTKTHEFMQQFNYPAISAISVHEAYPGHYVQFLWMHHVHDRVRKILGAMSNAEGWAHYCEQMMLDEGYADVGHGAKSEMESKLLHLSQLYEALLRNARFIVGIKLHTGQMTFDQAIQFFEKEAFVPHPGALIETKRGTTNPTYLYYTLGKLQIMKLRADLQAKLGPAFNLQQFHDDFMRQGYPPIKIVRKALLHDDSPTL